MAFVIVWLAVVGCIVVGAGWLLFHPEQIGAFFGRIAAGARAVL